MSDKLTRKEAKERTRQRLIDAVLDHVRHHGLKGLTTGKVADQAGIAQSSFYVHFTDMDEALRAVADKAGVEIRAIIRKAREKMDFSNPETAFKTAYAGAVDALLAEREFTELLLSHRRYRDSPLAETLRRVLDDARHDLANDLRASSYDESFLADVEMYADLMVGMTLTTVEGLMDGRIKDREAVVRSMARMTRAITAAALHR
jgi:AcrR family transcriptional regulator